ncbi:MAG: ROK family protein [Gemmatimonadaceae bacterium]
MTNVLAIDVGGTNVKLLVQGKRVPVKIPSGPTMTAARMVAAVTKATAEWDFDAVSIGYPGPVVRGRPAREPHNLGGGWMRADFARALGRPVRMINDAAMQALGSHEGRASGTMLFLGLGTGLGSALVLGDGVVVPMELAHLPYRHGRTYEEYVGAAGLERLGKDKWRKHVCEIVRILAAAMEADQIVLGGGNAKRLAKLRKRQLPAGTRLGDNSNAFRGGFRLWESDRNAHASSSVTPTS